MINYLLHIINILAAIFYFVTSGFLMTCKGNVVRKLAWLFVALGISDIIYLVVVVFDLVNIRDLHLMPYCVTNGALQVLVFLAALPFISSFLRRGKNGKGEQ